LHDAIGLLQIEKRAAHIGRDGALRGFQRILRRIPPRSRGLESSARRVPIEDMPGRIEPDDETVVELRTDCRVPLAISFVTSVCLHARPRLAAIEDQLLVSISMSISRARISGRVTSA
jgi:hypothetical protein